MTRLNPNRDKVPTWRSVTDYINNRRYPLWSWVAVVGSACLALAVLAFLVAIWTTGANTENPATQTGILLTIVGVILVIIGAIGSDS